MIPKSGTRFLQKITLKQKNILPFRARTAGRVFNGTPLAQAGLQQVVKFALQRIERGAPRGRQQALLGRFVSGFTLVGLG